MPDIREAKILIVATDGFEESELTVPQTKLKEAGAKVTVASPQSRQSKDAIRGWDKTDWGKNVPVDLDIESVNPADYDALVLPGGQINPDKLRLEPKALEVVRAFLTSGTLIAFLDAPLMPLFLRQGGGRDLPRPLAADRGRSGQGAQPDVVRLDQDRRDQRGRKLAGQGGRDR